MYKDILALTGSARMWCEATDRLVEKSGILSEEDLRLVAESYLMMRGHAENILRLLPDPEDYLEADDLLLTITCIRENGWNERFDRLAWSFLRLFTNVSAPQDTEHVLHLLADLSVFVLALHYCAAHIPALLDSFAKSA